MNLSQELNANFFCFQFLNINIVLFRQKICLILKYEFLVF